MLRELGTVDELFRLPASEPADIFEAIGQVPGFDVPGYDTPDTDNSGASRYVTHFTRTNPDDTTERVPVYIYQLARKVWIDLSLLRRGEGGDRIYQAIADYARATKRRLVGDPSGLSLDAVARRTYAMLSNMIRYGGDLGGFEPAKEQLEGRYASKGIPALKWPEDAEGRLQSLIENFHATISHAYPGIAGARFDFGTGAFRTRSGRALSARDFDQVAEAAAGREIPFGGRALRAGAFLNGLLHIESRERPRLLAKVLRQPAALVHRTGSLFSRAGVGGASQNLGTPKHSGLIDALFRGAIEPVTSRLVTPLYDRLIRAGGRVIPEKVKQALVSDYGLPEPYLDAKIDRQSAINHTLRQTRNLLDSIAGLDREQSRIAYLWMGEKPDTDLERSLMAQLSEDSRAAVQRMKELVDELGRKAVKVSLLSQDSYRQDALWDAWSRYLPSSPAHSEPAEPAVPEAAFAVPEVPEVPVPGDTRSAFEEEL